MNQLKRFAAAALSLAMMAGLLAQPAFAASEAASADSTPDGWVYIDNGDGTAALLNAAPAEQDSAAEPPQVSAPVIEDSALAESETEATPEPTGATIVAEGDGTLPWVLTSDGVLTICGEGAMEDYSYDADTAATSAPWFKYADQITRVVIEAGVTRVGTYAFSRCANLAEVSLPEGLQEIGASAFSKCANLLHISLPDSLTAIGDTAFLSCSILDLSALPANVTSIGEAAFEGCAALTLSTLPEGISTLDNYTFYNCSGLTSFTVPGSVTAIGCNVFQGCTGLTEVFLPASLTSVGSYAFDGCTSLTKVYYSGTQEKWTQITADSTQYLPAAAEVVVNASSLPTPASTSGTCGDALNWSVADGVLTISGSGAMYNYALDGSNDAPWRALSGDITTIVMKEGVTTVGFAAFSYLDKVVTMTYPATMAEIGPANMVGCTSLAEHIIAEGNPVYCTHEGAIVQMTTNTLFTVPAAKTGSFSTPSYANIIGGCAFEGCTGLTEINLHRNTDALGMAAFADCTGLTEITIPGYVTTLESDLFAGCTNLKTITFTGKEPTAVDASAFSGVTADVYYPDDWSWSASALQHYGGSLNWQSFTPEWTYADNVDGPLTLTGRTSLPAGQISLPRDVNGKLVTAVGDYALECCYDITNVIIQDSYTHIGDFAFGGLYNCTGFSIPATVTSLGRGAFSGSGAASIALSGAVESLPEFTFSGCRQLARVVLPDSLTTIDAHAFDGCTALTDVYFGGTIAQWNAIAVGECNDPLLNATIHCSDGDISPAPGTAFAFRYDEVHDEDGNAWLVINDYEGTVPADLVIPAEIDGVPVYAVDGQLFREAAIQTLTVEEGVRELHGWIFPFCTQLVSASLPSTLEYLGDDTFTGCSALTDITIGEGSRYYVHSFEDQGDAIYDGSTLVSWPSAQGAVEIIDGTTAIGPYAMEFTAVTEVTLPVSVLMAGNGAFYNCENLTKVTVLCPETVFGSVVFYKEEIAADQLTVYGYNGSTAETYASEYGHTFDAETLGEIPPEYVSPVADLTYHFWIEYRWSDEQNDDIPMACLDYITDGEPAGHVTIPSEVTDENGNTIPVLRLCSNLFRGKPILSVTVPEGVLYIEGDTFADCTALTKVTLPASVEWLDSNAFSNDNNLTDITFTGEGSYSATEDGIILADGGKTLVAQPGFTGGEFIMPAGVTEIRDWALDSQVITSIDLSGITRLGDGALAGNWFSGELVLPESLLYIGNCAFEGIHSYYQNADGESTLMALESVTILCPEAILGENVFNDLQVEGLETLTINGYAGSTAEAYANNYEYLTFKSIGEYEGDYQIPEATFSHFYWHVEHQQDEPYAVLDGLEGNPVGKLTIPSTVTDDEGNTFTVRVINGGAFSDLSGLLELSLPDTLVEIWDNCFIHCTNLRGVNLPASLEYIGPWAFNGCTSLLNISVAENCSFWITEDGAICQGDTLVLWPAAAGDVTVPEGIATIAHAAFGGTAITGVTLPDTVTQLKDNAFTACRQLTEIEIPDSVVLIGSYAFVECSKLQRVTVRHPYAVLGEELFAYAGTELPEETPFTLAGYEGSTLQAYAEDADITFDPLGEIPDGYTVPESDVEFRYEVQPYWDENGEHKAIMITGWDGLLLNSLTIPATIRHTYTETQENTDTGETEDVEITADLPVLTIAGSAFSNCTTLTSLTIEEGVWNIHGRAFAWCSGLTEVNLPASLQWLDGSAFAGCQNLTDIRIPEDENAVYTAKNGVVYTNNGCTLVTWPGASGYVTVEEDVTRIQAEAFVDTTITGITLPESLQVIEGWAFNETQLTEVTIPVNVLSIQNGAFANNHKMHTFRCEGNPLVLDEDILFCSGCDLEEGAQLTVYGYADTALQTYCADRNIAFQPLDGTAPEVVLPEIQAEYSYYPEFYWDEAAQQEVEGVAISGIYGELFGKLTLPETLPIQRMEDILDEEGNPTGDMQEVEVQLPVFRVEAGELQDSMLCEIVFPSHLQELYGGVINGCRYLTRVELPGTLRGLDGYAFSNCNNLTDIIIGDNTGYYTAQDGIVYAENNTALVAWPSACGTVTIPEGVVRIGGGALQCTGIEQVSLPDSLRIIGNDAFAWSCLNSVSIPATVVSIGQSAFQGCGNMTEATVYNAQAGIGRWAFVQCGEWLTEDGSSDFVLYGYENSTAQAHAERWGISFEPLEGEGADISQTAELTYNYEIITIYNGTEYVDGLQLNSIASGEAIGALTVPETINGLPVLALGSHLFAQQALTQVTLPDSIVFIHNDAFRDNVTLTSINVPANLVALYENAFTGCSSLETFIVPEDHPYYTTENGALYCSAADFQTQQGITYESGRILLAWPAAHGDITLPEDVAALDPWVFNSVHLDSLTLNNGLKELSRGALNGLCGVTELHLPASVTYLGPEALSYCPDLTNVYAHNPYMLVDSGLWPADWEFQPTIHGWEGSTLQSYCAERGLNFVADMGSMEDAGPMPEGTMLYQDGWHAIVKADGTAAIRFYSSDEDSYIHGEAVIPGEISGVTVTALEANALYEQCFMTSLTLPDSIRTVGDWAFSNCLMLESITLNEGLTSIGYAAFSECRTLTRLHLPASLTHAGDYCFNDTPSLTAITVAEGNTAFAAQDGVLFNADMTSLLLYPQAKEGASYAVPAGVTTIGNDAFYATLLESVTLSDSVTTIGMEAFYGSHNLSQLELGSGVETIDNYAFAFTMLQSLHLPAGLTTIGECALLIPACPAITLAEGNTAFTIVDNGLYSADMTQLYRWLGTEAHFTVPESVTQVMPAAFAYTGIQTVQLPAGLTRLGAWAFAFSGLTRISIPDGITFLETYLFSNCANLESAVLPASLNMIGNRTFSECYNLQTLYYPGTEEALQAVPAGWGNEVLYEVEVIFNYQPDPARIPGDVTNDGKISAADMLQLANYLAGKNLLDQDSYTAADLNGDGGADILDLITLCKVITGEVIL